MQSNGLRLPGRIDYVRKVGSLRGKSGGWGDAGKRMRRKGWRDGLLLAGNAG